MASSVAVRNRPYDVALAEMAMEHFVAWHTEQQLQPNNPRLQVNHWQGRSRFSQEFTGLLRTWPAFLEWGPSPEYPLA